MVTKREFAEHHNMLRLGLKPCIHAPQSTPFTAQDTLASSIVMSYADFYLPLGRISLSYGWQSWAPDQHGADKECSFAGRWGFNPAPWVSYRSLRIQARLLVQFGEYSKARVTPSLIFRACVSDYHPVWECIEKGDLVGVRRHLDIGSIGVNDTTLWGNTLLQEVGKKPNCG